MKDKETSHREEFTYVWITLKELVYILWKEVRKNKRWHIRENNGK